MARRSLEDKVFSRRSPPVGRLDSPFCVGLLSKRPVCFSFRTRILETTTVPVYVEAVKS